MPDVSCMVIPAYLAAWSEARSRWLRAETATNGHTFKLKLSQNGHCVQAHDQALRSRQSSQERLLVIRLYCVALMLGGS
jgi:hypothetical protein